MSCFATLANFHFLIENIEVPVRESSCFIILVASCFLYVSAGRAFPVPADAAVKNSYAALDRWTKKMTISSCVLRM